METNEHIRLTRRKLIVALGWMTLLPLAGLWERMISRKQAREEGRLSRMLIKDIPQGNTFYGEYWINRRKEGIKVFSNRCTHLGCRIRPADDGTLICPCHGSAFDPEKGSAIKGPAEKPLEILNFIIADNSLTIFIK